MTAEELASKVGEIEAALAASVEKQEELEKVNKRQANIIKLSPEERNVFDALPVEKQDEYLSADVEARKAYDPGDEDDDDLDPQVAKRLKDQEDTHKAELAKRDKEIADIRKRAAEAEEVAKAEREERQKVEFAKRAEKELGNYSGTDTDNGELLRALHNGVSKCLSKEQVDGLSKLLAAGNEALGKLQEPVGRDHVTKANSAWGQIEAKAAELQKNESGLTKEAAVSKVIRQNKELYQRYQEEEGHRA